METGFVSQLTALLLCLLADHCYILDSISEKKKSRCDVFLFVALFFVSLRNLAFIELCQMEDEDLSADDTVNV